MPRLLTIILAALVLAPLPGCVVGALVGGVAESYKRESTHTVQPEYKGLTGKSYAVIVTADRAIDSMYPGVVPVVTAKINERLRDHAGAKGWIDSNELLAYLYNNPRWAARPRSELAKDLGVERLVVVEMTEFRLNDPGNQYLWDGVAMGNIGVIDPFSALPDDHAFNKNIRVKFPNKSGYGPAEYSADVVMAALTQRFTDRASWLFYAHEEPYYPEY